MIKIFVLQNDAVREPECGRGRSSKSPEFRRTPSGSSPIGRPRRESRSLPPESCVCRTKSGRNIKGCTSRPWIRWPIFSGSISKAATISIPWRRNLSYPSRALPRLPAPASTASFGPVPTQKVLQPGDAARRADSRRAVCRQFRSFRCPSEPGWGRAPDRAPGRRRRPEWHRPPPLPAGCDSRSEGVEGWLRGFHAGNEGRIFMAEKGIEKSFSISNLHQCRIQFKYIQVFLPQVL